MDALVGIVEAMDRLRTELTQRIDAMVTRHEHAAEIRRIDTALSELRAEIAGHEAQRRADRRWIITAGTAIVTTAVALAAVITTWVGGG
jgi:hypothetical protein